MFSRIIISDILDFLAKKLCIAFFIIFLDMLSGNIWIKTLLLLINIHVIQESLNLHICVYQATEKVFWWFNRPSQYVSNRPRRYNHGRASHKRPVSHPNHYATPSAPRAPLSHPTGDRRVYDTVVTHTQGEYRYYCNCENCVSGLIERCANKKCNLCSVTFKF